MEQTKPMEQTKCQPQPLADGATTTDQRYGIIGHLFMGRPKLRVTSEYDSDSSVFLHKASCKVLNNLGKLKVSFRNSSEGEMSEPVVSFNSRLFSIVYDVESKDALVKSSYDAMPGLQLRCNHQVKARQGEIAVVADLAGPAYKLELSTSLPYVGMPTATFKFPNGEVALVEREKEVGEEKRLLAVNGILKNNILNGVLTAKYDEKHVNLRYAFKDAQMTLIPSISLPSNALACTFKRRFSPSDKLSYTYQFDTNKWDVVYKHIVGKDYKFKAGYDSDVRLGWASLWVGEENGRVKTAPLKMRVQFMLQVPQDDIGSSTLMFRVKKRWDV